MIRSSKSASLVLVAALAVFGLARCGGGGSGGSAATDTTGTDTSTIIDTGTTVVDTTDPGDTSGDTGDTGGDDGGCDGGGCNAFTSGGSKDTNLQKAKAQHLSTEAKAQALANRFDMSVQSATQVVQLANQVKAMSVQGQLTAKDQAAITQSAFAIGGVTTDQVNNAVQASQHGDNSAAEDLMGRAAEKMGMSSGAAFRDQVLPAVGIKYGK